MSATILMMWGPNFEMLGIREPEKYGSQTIDDHVRAAQTVATEYGFEIEHLQSSSEQELVRAIHAARGRCAAIVLNAGAFTHYAWSLHDALAIFDGLIIEVHQTNPNARESWRHKSVVSPVANGAIIGLGGAGYELAIHAVARLINDYLIKD